MNSLTARAAVALKNCGFSEDEVFKVLRCKMEAAERKVRRDAVQAAVEENIRRDYDFMRRIETGEVDRMDAGVASLELSVRADRIVASLSDIRTIRDLEGALDSLPNIKGCGEITIEEIRSEIDFWKKRSLETVLNYAFAPSDQELKPDVREGFDPSIYTGFEPGLSTDEVKAVMEWKMLHAFNRFVDNGILAGLSSDEWERE